MLVVDPASLDFESLPRREQARIYASLKWTIDSLMDEFGVSAMTIRLWINPELAARQKQHNATYAKTERGRATAHRYNRTPAGRAAKARYNEKRRELKASLRSEAKSQPQTAAE